MRRQLQFFGHLAGLRVEDADGWVLPGILLITPGRGQHQRLALGKGRGAEHNGGLQRTALALRVKGGQLKALARGMTLQGQQGIARHHIAGRGVHIAVAALQGYAVVPPVKRAGRAQRGLLPRKGQGVEQTGFGVYQLRRGIARHQLPIVAAAPRGILRQQPADRMAGELAGRRVDAVQRIVAHQQ